MSETREPEGGLTVQVAEVVTTEQGRTAEGRTTITTTAKSLPADRSWAGSLFASEDVRADSIVVAGLLSAFAGCVFQLLAQLGIGGQYWNPINFGGMVTAILGGLGVGKGVRNYLSASAVPPAPAPPAAGIPSR